MNRKIKIVMVAAVLISLAIIGIVMLYQMNSGEKDKFAGDQGFTPITTSEGIDIENEEDKTSSGAVDNTIIIEEDPSNKPEKPLEEIEVVPEKDWIDAKLEEYGDQISDADAKAIKSIVRKLDVNYAMGLLNNTDAAAGEEEFKSYLRGRLSEGEYNKTKELVSKYSHLL